MWDGLQWGSSWQLISLVSSKDYASDKHSHSHHSMWYLNSHINLSLISIYVLPFFIDCAASFWYNTDSLGIDVKTLLYIIFHVCQTFVISLSQNTFKSDHIFNLWNQDRLDTQRICFIDLCYFLNLLRFSWRFHVLRYYPLPQRTMKYAFIFTWVEKTCFIFGV